MSSSPADKTPPLAGRVEFFLRRLFERIGGAFDFALRRPMNPQTRTDLSALVPPIERAIEGRLREEGSQVTAPNLIELRYDFETYSSLTPARIKFLERELAATVFEYINNRRYRIQGAVKVKITFDVFTQRLTVRARFPDEGGEETQSEEKEAAQPAPQSCRLKLKGSGLELKSQLSGERERANVGRSRDNQMVIDDATVSNFHAAFAVASNGVLWLTDLGSSNGTYVNGVRLNSGEKASVRSGDRIRVGDVELTLSVDG
jgi:hypothetical protein